MRIQLVIEQILRHLQCRHLRSRLDRMAGDLGPGSFRAPKFLETEAELGLMWARLAEIECQMGRREASEQAESRAGQIHTALCRFLQQAELGRRERERLQAKLEDIKEILSKIPDRYAAV